MASKRDLKKNIQRGVYDIVEEAYMLMLENPGKKDKEADELIDSCAIYLDDVMPRITRLSKAEEPAKEAASIREEWTKHKQDWEKKLKSLQK